MPSVRLTPLEVAETSRNTQTRNRTRCSSVPSRGRMKEMPRKASAQYQAPTPSTIAARAWPANLAVLVRPRLRWLRIFR